MSLDGTVVGLYYQVIAFANRRNNLAHLIQFLEERFMLRLLAKLLKALNSESDSSQISLALVAGMIVGVTPFWSLHNLIVLFLVCVIRVNVSAFFVAVALFTGIGYLLDPLMDDIGAQLLAEPSLQAFWTGLYSNTGWRLAHFNNTLTLGSFVSAIVVALPMFFITKTLIKLYRAHVLEWVGKLKIVMWLRATPFYRAYSALSGDHSL